MTAPVASTKETALAYARRGFLVFPVHGVRRVEGGFVCTCRYGAECKASGKHPVWRLAPQGLKNASIDQAVVGAMFSGFGSRNIAIATGSKSGFVVLDIDKRHGGFEALAALEAKHGVLPETLQFCTGGGGIHYLFRHPGGVIPNSAGQISEGIDVRGDGGYIVAPPSRHVSGGQYEIAEGCSLDTPLADAPAWLLGLMRQGGGHSRNAARPNIADLVRGQIPEGRRNTSIASIAGHLLAKRVDPRICLDLLLAFNDARCSPPLSAGEVARVVASIEHRAFTNLINRT